MRRVLAFSLILALFVGAMPGFAARGGQKGASERAYEQASDQAVFHRVGDWFATRGKPEKEKKANCHKQ